MANGYDVWGVVAGVIGILGLIPLMCSLVQSQLPSSKLKVLDDILTETSTLFRTVCEEGLLKDRRHVEQMEETLNVMWGQAENYRAATHCATTIFKELKEWHNGLSRNISLLCNEVIATRAKISETSAAERRKLLDSVPNAGHHTVPASSNLDGLSYASGKTRDAT